MSYQISRADVSGRRRRRLAPRRSPNDRRQHVGPGVPRGPPASASIAPGLIVELQQARSCPSFSFGGLDGQPGVSAGVRAPLTRGGRLSSTAASPTAGPNRSKRSASASASTRCGRNAASATRCRPGCAPKASLDHAPDLDGARQLRPDARRHPVRHLQAREDSVMENTPAFHPLDYVSVVRRRMWWLIVPPVLAAVVGAALVMWLPREYLEPRHGRRVAARGVGRAGRTHAAGHRRRARRRDHPGPEEPGGARAHRQGRRARQEHSDQRRDPVARPPHDDHDPAGRSQPAAGDDHAVHRAVPGRHAGRRRSAITNRLAELFVEESSRSAKCAPRRRRRSSACSWTQSQTRLNELEGAAAHGEGKLHGRAARADQRQRRDGDGRSSSSSRRRRTPSAASRTASPSSSGRSRR